MAGMQGESFKEARKNLLIDAEGNKPATLSVAVMNEAGVGCKGRQIEGRIGWAIHGWSSNKEIQTIQDIARGMKVGS